MTDKVSEKISSKIKKTKRNRDRFSMEKKDYSPRYIEVNNRRKILILLIRNIRVTALRYTKYEFSIELIINNLRSLRRIRLNFASGFI